jgi:hypothetical protein
MSLPSATLALLTSLLIVGCATKQPPPTATQTQKKDTAAHPDPSGGAMSGSELEWSKVNPRHGGFNVF